MHYLCAWSPQTPSCYLFNQTSKLQFFDNSNYDGGLYTIIRRPPLLMLPTRNKNHHGLWILAMESESNYEVDQDKARQALSELDQQLESLSTKQINPPKIKASSLMKLKEMKNEPLEISGSFLGYTAFVLFVFTILYNILFLTVIKPSIDGPEEDIVATDVTTTYQITNVS